MRFRFDYRKSLQASAVLLEAERNRQMSYLRLLKLLYIADRELLASTGRPLTGDHPLAMKHGPLLSTVFDLVKGQSARAGEWDEFIHSDGYVVELRADPGRGELSKGEVAKLQELTSRYHGLNDWELVEETHQFGEWQESIRTGPATPISWTDALAAQGQSKMAAVVERDEQARQTIDRVFGG